MFVSDTRTRHFRNSSTPSFATASTLIHGMFRLLMAGANPYAPSTSLQISHRVQINFACGFRKGKHSIPCPATTFNVPAPGSPPRFTAPVQCSRSLTPRITSPPKRQYRKISCPKAQFRQQAITESAEFAGKHLLRSLIWAISAEPAGTKKTELLIQVARPIRSFLCAALLRRPAG